MTPRRLGSKLTTFQSLAQFLSSLPEHWRLRASSVAITCMIRPILSRSMSPNRFGWERTYMARYTMISCVTHRKDYLQPKEFFSGLIIFFIDYRNKKESKANCLIYFYDHQYRVQEQNYPLKIIFNWFSIMEYKNKS